jgi:hypothetical protein
MPSLAGLGRAPCRGPAALPVMLRGSAQIRGAVHWLIVGFLLFDNQQDCCH